MEIWIFFGLAVFFLLFSTLAIALFCTRKRCSGKAHLILLAVSLIFLICFITFGFAIASVVLNDWNNQVLTDIVAAYENFWINIIYLGVLVPLLLSCYLLLFSIRAGVHTPKKAASLTNITSQFSSYFAKFDEDIDDDKCETFEPNDVFKDFGNNENDVALNIDRIIKKMRQNSKNNMSKNTIQDIRETMGDKSVVKNRKKL